MYIENTDFDTDVYTENDRFLCHTPNETFQRKTIIFCEISSFCFKQQDWNLHKTTGTFPQDYVKIFLHYIDFTFLRLRR